MTSQLHPRILSYEKTKNKLIKKYILTETKLHPEDWEAISGVEIIDPDGWDRSNIDSWNTHISIIEFYNRAENSTTSF